VAYFNQIGILLALLIVLGGLLVLRTAEGETAARRLIYYLLLVGSALLLVLLGSILITPQQDNRPYWQVLGVINLAIIGVLALIGLHGRQLLTMGRGAQIWALLLLLLLAAMGIAYLNTSFDLAYLILFALAILVLGWAVGRRYRNTAVLLAVLLSLALLALNLMWSQPSTGLPPSLRWLNFIIMPVMLAAPGLIVVISAVLIANALQDAEGVRPWLLFALALGLLVYLAYSIYWASVWDQTSDGLGGLMLSFPATAVAVGAGMVMAYALRGWQRGVGLLFAILVPLLLSRSFQRGWQISYHDLTETRAERIVQALADYRRREGSYPATLAALTPRDLLRLPQPVELRGETWCYQGSANFFRLGAFSREFFSSPVNLHVYAAEGEPDSVWPCEGELPQMKARYYSPMEDPAAMQPPLPTPLPPSEEALEGEPLSPLLGESGMVWGSWSPDSAYFFLGQGDGAGKATLSFLDGRSGELCPISTEDVSSPEAYSFPPGTVTLRRHHAWLPDGRLLLLDGMGQTFVLSPCSSAVRLDAPDTAGMLNEFLANDPISGRVLAKSDGHFWIFDSRTLTWQPIPGVTPNPYDLHWDNAAWQPGGELLAVSRLNGRDAGDGSTLYIIAGDSGQMLRSLPLAEASDQSAPRVDWLLPQELLLSGPGVLRILDLSGDPPASTDVLADIFSLDLDFPDEVWGHSWQVDWDNGRYTLAVQANHARDQALYYYQSAAAAVDIYDEDANLLLRYPDGQIEQWARPGGEAQPEAADQFLLIDVAEGKVYPPLTIDGHTPRDTPRLSMTYLEGPDRLAVASSQGISLHTLPDGTMTHFWTLAGQGFAPYLLPAPDGRSLLAARDQGGLYWIPLP
jgi:hypothetical protein